MKKGLLKFFTTIIGLYTVMCGLLYFFQEKLIFFPKQLDKNHQFEFTQRFEERNIKATDGKIINGLLFKADQPKGLIFYLHGNAGSLNSWGDVAKTYTDLNYDVFIIDYRGYGKSEGEINGQNQLFEDNQSAYNELKKEYNEDQIIVLGYSIGTGLASKLASTNNPKLLILQAPYYNLTDMMTERFSYIPTFILRYKLENNEYLKKCKMPVFIFHDKNDEVISYNSALKLKQELKKQATLITLNGQGHNGMTENSEYKIELTKILAK